MIDFTNGSILKLKPVDPQGVDKVSDILLGDEYVKAAFAGGRDMVVFTDKRVIAVNAQGMTGKKVDYSSLPYSKVQAFSIESAGSLDRDAELELWFSGLGKVKFEFGGDSDILAMARLIAEHVL